MWLLSLFLLTSPFWQEPQEWQPPLVVSVQEPSPSLSRHFFSLCIRFHQKVISPADGPRSHFFPSSSQYALDAFRLYGFPKAVLFSCDRLMRENADPWDYPILPLSQEHYLKWDPVPEPRP